MQNLNVRGLGAFKAFLVARCAHQHAGHCHDLAGLLQTECADVRIAGFTGADKRRSSSRLAPAALVAIENGKRQSWRVTALEGRRFCCCLLDLGA